MSLALAALLIVAALWACILLNTRAINRRRDRARDEQLLEQRRRRGLV